MIQLENKLYTSTEVADILGVSLRSVYRYIEEDKLVPEVKTATGRHRFTRQNIIDFLYPNGEGKEGRKVEEIDEAPVKKAVRKPLPQAEKRETDETEVPVVKEGKGGHRVGAEVAEQSEEYTHKVDIDEITPVKETVKEKVYEKSHEQAEVKEEPAIDWLSKFREAAKKFEESSAKEESTIFTKETPKVLKYYYRSKLGGLKDIAQNIDKASKNSGLDYAFTMSAGLSLHSPIKPFSLLHAYVRSKDRDFFERVLMLTPSDEENGQICLILSDEAKIYNDSMHMHGLSVVSKDRLLSDIREMDTDNSLIKEAEGILG